MIEKSVKLVLPVSKNLIYNDDILDKYNFGNGIPKTVLIDKEGRLVFKQLGALNSIEELKALILNTKSSQ